MTSVGFNPSTYRRYADISTEALQQECWLYKNPQADILQTMNRLMFLVGTEAANLHQGTRESSLDPGAQTHTKALSYLEGRHNVFATNLHWFGGAVIVELLCIALFLPTYFGFWRLGRSVFFSPLEVAKVCPTFTFVSRFVLTDPVIAGIRSAIAQRLQFKLFWQRNCDHCRLHSNPVWTSESNGEGLEHSSRSGEASVRRPIYCESATE